MAKVYFTLDELTRSDYALRRGIDNEPDANAIKALMSLVDNVLIPVREAFGKPVIITSGYRCPKVNKAIGGSSTSDHCFGRAADFTIPGFPNYEVCEWIRDNLAYKQLIYEYGEAGWVHCAFAIGLNKRSVLTATKRNGKTVYLPGLQHI